MSEQKLTRKEKLNELVGFTCSHCDGFFALGNGYYALQQFDGLEKQIENQMFCSVDDLVIWLKENRKLFLLVKISIE